MNNIKCEHEPKVSAFCGIDENGEDLEIITCDVCREKPCLKCFEEKSLLGKIN